VLSPLSSDIGYRAGTQPHFSIILSHLSSFDHALQLPLHSQNIYIALPSGGFRSVNSIKNGKSFAVFHIEIYTEII